MSFSVAQRGDFVDPCGIDAQNANPMFIYVTFFEYFFSVPNLHLCVIVAQNANRMFKLIVENCVFI